MQKEKESPKDKRERLRQEELKNNPLGNIGDASNRAANGNLADLVGSLGWKGTGILIILLVIAYFIYSIFFSR